MRRAALVLALLVAVPVAAGAPPADTPSTTPPRDGPQSVHRINVLTLSDSTRSAFATGSVDVATSIEVQRAAAAGRLDRYTLDDRVRNASDDDARRQLLFEAMIETKVRSAELLERTRTLRTAYANDSIDTGTFLDRFVRQNVRASILGLYLDRIEGHADRIPGFSLQRRLQVTRTRLIGLQGPVGDRALRSIHGTSPPTRFYVDTSPNGAVLSMIVDGRYVREAYRADRRSEDGEAIGLEVVVDRMRTLYPAIEAKVPSNIEGQRWGGQVYRITFDISDGSLVAYLDGETENVFYEIQERRLDSFAGAETAGSVANGTRLVVNRSYSGAPLRIAVYDDATGAPVEASVLVAGTRVETGADGVAWTLTPGTERFTVTAVRPGGNVTTFVRPVPPPGLNTTA